MINPRLFLCNQKAILNIIKYLPDYSYTKFLLLNPNATRKERKKSVKAFLDATRK